MIKLEHTLLRYYDNENLSLLKEFVEEHNPKEEKQQGLLDNLFWWRLIFPDCWFLSFRLWGKRSNSQLHTPSLWKTFKNLRDERGIFPRSFRNVANRKNDLHAKSGKIHFKVRLSQKTINPQHITINKSLHFSRKNIVVIISINKYKI